jgi:hypothetical protein
MSIDIFIRSYPKDFFLLNYCLHSIKRFVKGYRDIVLVIRNKNHEQLLKDVDVSNVKVITSHDFDDSIDYCGQQICKLYANIWSDAEYFFYVDSDCIFYDTFDIHKKYFDENKNIILFKEYWHNLQSDSFVWQGCLRELDLLTEFETMRRLPQIYPSRILLPIRNLIENKTGKDYINGCLDIYKKVSFSEFNIMGSYILLYDQKNINMMLYDPKYNQIPCKQFWSHEKREILLEQISKLLFL